MLKNAAKSTARPSANSGQANQVNATSLASDPRPDYCSQSDHLH